MSVVSLQVRRARHRLWLNIWLDVGGRVLACSAAVLALTVLLARLMGWTVPWMMVAGAMALVSLIASLVWSFRVRPSDASAAAALDQSAGLRERISSSLFLDRSEDPFAKAVCADAERRAASLTVARHLRLRFPASLATAGGTIVLAALMFLIPEGLLAPAEAKIAARDEERVTRTRVEVKKQLEQVKAMVQTNPALSDLQAEIDKLDSMPTMRMDKPSDLRHEALKKIDGLADAVRRKQEGDRFDKVAESKRMLRALQEPAGERTPVQKLARNLAAGDFKAAQETLEQVQEQLATLKQDSDKQFVEKMQKQLEDLARQLDTVARQDQLKRNLEQAGLKKEDVERMLERLSKEDLDQVKEQLEKNGLSQKTIDQICQECKRQQGASQAMRQMSKAMQNAARASGDGQMGDAAGAMEMAGDQLSELEMLEQEMNQLDSALAGLQGAKNGLGGDPCSQCNGTGRVGTGQCPKCGGSGTSDVQGGSGGMGKLGQGRGGLAPQQETAVDFKIERGKVETTMGRIIGQFLVDGEQVKGEATEEFVELIAAAERVATDTVNRDRIPRQYQKAVKEYFARLPETFGLTTDKSDAGEQRQDQPSEEQPEDDEK